MGRRKRYSEEFKQEALRRADEPGVTDLLVVEELGLAQVTDSGEIAGAVAQAIADNPSAVGDFLGGKETAAKFLVVRRRKATRGSANAGNVASLATLQLGVLQP